MANPAAQFRDGQWQAIDALVNQGQKLLVVQRTGWGKSSVYFISTKIFRDRNLGSTIIVSPLLALMRNQIESAQRLGLVAETMNSTNVEDWRSVTARVLANQVDCLLISPERLANDSFIETVLTPIADRIALMVIDEAHCISDWGHDFRPDYRRIVNILRQLPAHTPVLGTTATANNRVVADIQSQLGDIQIQRGQLNRESLALQTMWMPDQASRLAWLAQVIPTLPGTGIVYTLTIRDAEQVALWLKQNGINAKAYHGSIEADGFENSNVYRQQLEEQLQQLFPAHTVTRLDRDSIRRKGSLQKALDQILQGEPQLILGTQMLAKGHHFPNVGLVVIIDVDSALYSNDFRAPEQLAQLLTQVSGRAGRGSQPGKVLLQTHYPGHALLQDVIQNGYASFARSALKERQQTFLPPFMFLTLFRVEAHQLELCKEWLQKVAEHYKNWPQVQLLGPLACPMERKAGKYRWQIQLFAKDRKQLHQSLDSVLVEISRWSLSRKVKWQLDVDPQDLN